MCNHGRKKKRDLAFRKTTVKTRKWEKKTLTEKKIRRLQSTLLYSLRNCSVGIRGNDEKTRLIKNNKCGVLAL